MWAHPRGFPMRCLPSRLLPILLFTAACAACSSSPTRGVLNETADALPENVPAAAFSTCKKPTWPPSALMRKEQGVTLLALLVGADGKLRRADVIGSSGSAELDSAAKAMMSSCRFVPAIVRGDRSNDGCKPCTCGRSRMTAAVRPPSSGS
ncbi:energy transducer TonB [Massilia niabensis]|uniref:Energy transducer TonB n=1 Tax=Massilia niabensis TaxID=544910 RepID=A0ABW0LBS6_9BURK